MDEKWKENLFLGGFKRDEQGVIIIIIIIIISKYSK
jgi:hypothetical protein